MNEDLHIEKAAHLADKPAAEDLATDRARKFVADAISAQRNAARGGNLFVRRPAYVWGGVSLAIAASVALAIILFRPAPEDGTPGLVMENHSSHAQTEVADSLKTENSDTLVIETVVLPE